MHLQKPHRSLLTSPLMPRGRMSGMEAGWSEPSASQVSSGVVVKQAASYSVLAASRMGPTGVKLLGQQGRH